MEAGFFIKTSNQKPLIERLKQLYKTRSIFRTFVRYEILVDVESKQTRKIKFLDESKHTVNDLYAANPDSLYFSGDYYGNPKSNDCPAMDAKVTMAQDGIILVIKYDHRIIDGGSMMYIVNMILSGNLDKPIQTYQHTNEIETMRFDWLDVFPKIYHPQNMFTTNILRIKKLTLERYI